MRALCVTILILAFFLMCNGFRVEVGKRGLVVDYSSKRANQLNFVEAALVRF